MKTLLINGCSFGHFWTPSQEFITKLGCDKVTNLSKVGTSFQRTCRSTVEWIAQNGKPNLVLIPITFSHRWELALNLDEDDIDGSWVPLQNSQAYEISTASWMQFRRFLTPCHHRQPERRTNVRV